MFEEHKSKEYKEQRDLFLKMREERIKTISEFKGRISLLESEIENSIPTTENGIRLCVYCEIKSMKRVRTKPSDYYVCEICGYEEGNVIPKSR